MRPRPLVHRPAALLLATLAALALAGLVATAALADDGGMSGMPGMTKAQMQTMAPSPAPSAAQAPATGAMQKGQLAPAMSQTQSMPGMDMGSGSVNWSVIGGFVAAVAAATAGAAALKRSLRRRMAAGELATAGVQHV
jgi:hypothetical protein